MVFSKNGGESMVFSLYPVPQELDELLRGTCIGAPFVNAQGGGTLMHRGHCVHFSGPLSIGNLQCIFVYHHPLVHEISGGVSLEISFIVKFYSRPLEAI